MVKRLVPDLTAKASDGASDLPHDLDLFQDWARGSFIGTVDSVPLKNPPSAQMFLEGEK